MSKLKENKEEEIKNLLKKAIEKLQEKDVKLLDEEFNINERTVTHRLAMYLAELFPNLDVDCEYNRMSDENPKKFIPKRVSLQKIEDELKLDDTDAKTVFPDIIIHQRKTNHNLLAIEVKMGWKMINLDFDNAKLNSYKNILGYLFAVQLTLGPGLEYKLNWK